MFIFLYVIGILFHCLVISIQRWRFRHERYNPWFVKDDPYLLLGAFVWPLSWLLNLVLPGMLPINPQPQPTVQVVTITVIPEREIDETRSTYRHIFYQE